MLRGETKDQVLGCTCVMESWARVGAAAAAVVQPPEGSNDSGHHL